MPNDGGSQGNPQNSGGEKPHSESSTATDVHDQSKTGTATGPTDKDKSTTQPTSEEIAAIRRDSRSKERRVIVKTLQDQGFDVSNKTLDDFLKGLDPAKISAGTIVPKDEKDPKVKDKAKTGDDDEESATAKLLRKENEALKQSTHQLMEAHRQTIIEGAITRAVAGADFANERAASDAIVAFQQSHRFDLADDNRTVRVLDKDGEPVLKGYKEITVREAFDQFITDRPYFRKAETKPTQTTVAQKGTTSSASTMNDVFRKFRRGG